MTKDMYYGDVVRVLKCFAVVEGRLKFAWPATVNADALPVAKTGLVSVLLDKVVPSMEGGWEGQVRKHPATFVLLTWLIAVFSERKAFTLESQKQGGLNSGQQELLKYCLTHEPTGAYLLALILPVQEVFELVSDDMKQRYLTAAVELQGHLHTFYHSEWDKGVWKSARRQMRVLPRGAGVNSTAVNAVADALQNLRRFILVCGGNPFTWAPLQLIANDQFRMGGGRVHPKTKVFEDLSRQGFFCWDVSDDPAKNLTFVQALVKSCSEHGCSVHSWIGVPSLRGAEVTDPVDMICGCAVPKMSKPSADVLKACGVFGARPWTGAEEKPPPTLGEAVSALAELFSSHDLLMVQHRAAKTCQRAWKLYRRNAARRRAEKLRAEKDAMQTSFSMFVPTNSQPTPYAKVYKAEMYWRKPDGNLKLVDVIRATDPHHKTIKTWLGERFLFKLFYDEDGITGERWETVTGRNQRLNVVSGKRWNRSLDGTVTGDPVWDTDSDCDSDYSDE